jgi:hypothetical protein
LTPKPEPEKQSRGEQAEGGKWKISPEDEDRAWADMQKALEELEAMGKEQKPAEEEKEMEEEEEGIQGGRGGKEARQGGDADANVVVGPLPEVIEAVPADSALVYALMGQRGEKKVRPVRPCPDHARHKARDHARCIPMSMPVTMPVTVTWQ